MKMQIDCNITLWTGFVKKSGIERYKKCCKAAQQSVQLYAASFLQKFFLVIKRKSAVRHRFSCFTELVTEKIQIHFFVT